ncbi:hypothetical protein [Methanimicrococcus blatticola]|nr:hypothetical protein [Methanimicrococcus blatticola]
MERRIRTKRKKKEELGKKKEGKGKKEEKNEKKKTQIFRFI